MKVRAVFPTETMFGFYGEKRRYDGDEFEYEGKLASWMEKVEEEEEKPKRRGRPAKVADDSHNDVPAT